MVSVKKALSGLRRKQSTSRGVLDHLWVHGGKIILSRTVRFGRLCIKNAAYGTIKQKVVHKTTFPLLPCGGSVKFEKPDKKKQTRPPHMYFWKHPHVMVFLVFPKTEEIFPSKWHISKKLQVVYGLCEGIDAGSVNDQNRFELTIQWVSSRVIKNFGNL